jgi:Ca2+/Na+ antiporter
MLCSEKTLSMERAIQETEQETSVFYRREGSGSIAVTVALLVLWLFLAVYLIAHPDPISIIVLVVGMLMAVFAFFVMFFVRRAQREQYHNHSTAMTDPTSMSATTDRSNGHHRNPTATDQVGNSDADSV